MRWSIAFALLAAGSGSLWAAPQIDGPELARRALQAEAAGDPAQREALLKEASALSPDEPLVRWLQGEVRYGKTWKSYQALTDEAKSSTLLQTYREKRDASEPTLDSQLALAQFCQRKGLAEQAKAHWSAVIELDPEHLEARKHLGFDKLQGRWVKREDLLKDKERLARVAATYKRIAPGLKSLVGKLESGEWTDNEACEQLRKDADVSAIPAWESLVSAASASGAQAVISVLSEMNDPEASLSLVRHAIWLEWPQARASAAQALRNRDELSYLPALLGELRGPWIGWRQVATDGRNQLVYRFSAIADGSEQRTLHTFDQAYSLVGDRTRAAGQAAQSSRLTEYQLEVLRLRENEAIRAYNDRVMQVLSDTTDITGFDSPQDWWQWWDDRNEVFSASSKPIETTYAFRSSTVVGLPPAPSRPSSGSSPRVVREVKKDCLAGGTPILTQRGPVAVERIRIGDMVLAQHPDTGELALQPVLRTTIREPEPLIRIQMGDKHLRASGGHLFWVSGKGWLRAREIKVGMHLHGMLGGTAVTAVVVEDKPTRTFNLVVANFHSYFVGPGQVLSHDNSAAQPTHATIPGLSE